MLSKQARIMAALHEADRECCLKFKRFCDEYYWSHKAPFPSDDELWVLYMEKLAEEEKLHTA